MANIAHSEVYERIAVAAARKAGSKALTPEAVALDPEGRAARDLAWAEYDRVLADVRTYRLEAIRKWLAERGVRASTSPIHRDRARILRVRRQVELANARTREGLELMKDLSAGDVLEGAMTRAGQILYEKFSRLDLESLEGLTPSQILNAFQAAGYLKKVAGDAALQGARLAEIRRRFDESVEAAQKKGSGGRLTDDDVREIRKAVFGDGA